MNRGLPKISILKGSEERTGDVSTRKVRSGKRPVLVLLIFFTPTQSAFFPVTIFPPRALLHFQNSFEASSFFVETV